MPVDHSDNKITNDLLSFPFAVINQISFKPHKLPALQLFVCEVVRESEKWPLPQPEWTVTGNCYWNPSVDWPKRYKFWTLSKLTEQTHHPFQLHFLLLLPPFSLITTTPIHLPLWRGQTPFFPSICSAHSRLASSSYHSVQCNWFDSVIDSISPRVWGP